MSGFHSDWWPVATRSVLEARAATLDCIRDFFRARGVLEVSTPVVSRATITDPDIPSLAAQAQDGRRWLQTSPEFPMKRLLAAGSGDIYQVCPVFRDGERGQWHNPEFALLEWYRLGFDDHDLAIETVSLIREVLNQDWVPHRDGLLPMEVLTYREAFLRHANLDPFEVSDEHVAEQAIAALGTGGPASWTREDWLDLLASARVYPALGRGCITVLTDFPASQAALARLRPEDPSRAARFEVILDGVELANGFHELADAQEQRRRFERDNARRESEGLASMPVDEHLLSALSAGLPDVAGVALGLDRLLALALGADGIDAVLTFPWERA
ncbi:lysyl-tRNA synthetase class 2 [Natronospira proteinivora]|uniref:Lysyl-tRNA synthetase class 2 n=1 Tax=Natronospira proteinivora TaxID=1807133 RepID=A0ABT1G884_9GAMM|nr:EF-P lysine aminoacylase EpmA [Natronospira proteinivora]MCP1727120.1 lysyl-tRNA synthetase class 2 [Natronospira proteinivora]